VTRSHHVGTRTCRTVTAKLALSIQELDGYRLEVDAKAHGRQCTKAATPTRAWRLVRHIRPYRLGAAATIDLDLQIQTPPAQIPSALTEVEVRYPAEPRLRAERARPGRVQAREPVRTRIAGDLTEAEHGYECSLTSPGAYGWALYTLLLNASSPSLPA